MSPLPTIFVLMASYRDRECQHTVRDLFAKAAHPERVFVGICCQFDTKGNEDASCFELPYPYPEQVRVINYDYREAKGANWGRQKASFLWQGEDYIYFTEPHNRFEQGWDELLILMHKQCASPKAILTSVESSYTLPNNLGRPLVGSLSVRMFYTNDIILINTHAVPDQLIPELPFLSPVLMMRGSFAPSAFLQEVPIDPYIYFEGDESSTSARAWTHGWDIYCATIPVSYHLDDRGSRSYISQDMPQKSSELSELAAERFRYLFGMQDTASAAAKKDLEKYGLGTTRSLKEYENFAGIDFRNRIVHDQSRWIIKDGPESVHRPAPKRIQQWQMNELRGWISNCIANNVDMEHILNTCQKWGIDKAYAQTECETIRQTLT